MKPLRPMLLLASLFLLMACNETTPTTTLTPRTVQLSDEMTRAEIDEIILKDLENGVDFNWANQDERMLWSATKLSDNYVQVGYKGDAAKQSVFELSKTSKKDVFAEADELDLIAIKVKTKEDVIALRQNPQIRYVEPLGYDPKPKGWSEKSASGGSGCSATELNPPPSWMYWTSTPNSAKVPWNWGYHNIAYAWNNSPKGEGIEIGMIDTGVSSQQSRLGSLFVSGESIGRSAITKIGTFHGDRPNPNGDDCIHGTLMAGTIAGPKNGPTTTGIAYKANFVAYRASDDVVLDDNIEVWGVIDAIRNAADRPNLKIISMSMGRLTSESGIRDAVRYAVNTKGKLFFAAGGTSTLITGGWFNIGGVIFPASMPEIMAVTGVKSTSTTNFTRCSNCHSGSEIDFVVVMQGGDNTSLSLPLSGTGTAEVGGSSIATATMAGIAGLVWSKYPSWNRTQIIERLRTSANFGNNRTSSYGWGIVNAQTAVQ